MRKRVSFHHTRDIINNLSGAPYVQEERTLGILRPCTASTQASPEVSVKEVEKTKNSVGLRIHLFIECLIAFASFQSSFLKSLSFISANSITIRTYPLLLLKIRMQARIILSLLRILSPLLPSQTKLLSFL